MNTHEQQDEMELDQLLAGERETGTLSPGFNAALRARWEREAGIAPAKARAWTLRRVLPLSGAAAVLALCALAWVVMDAAGGASVAWADVARAVRTAPYFQMTAVADGPRSGNGPKLFRVELFHRAPDAWRAQGLGQVWFSRSGEEKKFDVDATDETRGMTLIPEEFIPAVKQRGLLDAVLLILFQGNPPAGEPVAVDDAATEAGIAVFDYAHDATRQWARIWVLRESKLPVMMKVFNPEYDDTVLVTFDYATDPGERFFDAAYFEKTLDEGDEPWEAYRIGAAPVDRRKPTASDQIYDARGGYVAGEFREAARDAAGNVMIVATNPENPPAPGHGSFDEGYAELLHDNWGNTYMRSGFGYEYEPERRQVSFFVPVEPFRAGKGPQTFELEYAIRFHGGDPGDIVLDRRTVEVPLVDPPAKPEQWSAFVAQREQALRRYLREYTSLERQLQYLEPALAAHPNHIDLNEWMHRLLQDHGRDAEAQAWMESRLLPQLIENPLRWYSTLQNYLFDLYRRGEIDRIRELREPLLATKERLLREAKQKPWEKQGIEHIYQNKHNGLENALQIPALLDAAATAAKPTVEEVVRTGDGFLIVRFGLPEGWNPSRRPTRDADGQWIGGSRRHDGRTYWEIFQPRDLQVWPQTFRPTLGNLLIDSSGLNDVIATVTLEVPIPPQPNAPKMPDYVSRHVPGMAIDAKYFLSPTEVVEHHAETLIRGGKLEEALAAFRRIDAMPDADFPGWTRDPANPGALDRARAEVREQIGELLIDLGRYDEARPIIDGFAARVPADYRYEDQTLNHYRGIVVDLEARQAQRLVREGKLDEAEALLDRVAASLPALEGLRDKIRVTTSGGWSTYSPRWTAERHQQRIDSVRWDLRDARRGVQPGAAGVTPPPAPAGSAATPSPGSSR